MYTLGQIDSEAREEVSESVSERAREKGEK